MGAKLKVDSSDKSLDEETKTSENGKVKHMAGQIRKYRKIWQQKIKQNNKQDTVAKDDQNIDNDSSATRELLFCWKSTLKLQSFWRQP